MAVFLVAVLWRAVAGGKMAFVEFCYLYICFFLPFCVNLAMPCVELQDELPCRVCVCRAVVQLCDAVWLLVFVARFPIGFWDFTKLLLALPIRGIT